MKDSFSYHITTGPVTDLIIHARRKRLDHAEAVARRMSSKYPKETYRVWEAREYDGIIGRTGSSRVVAAYKAGGGTRMTFRVPQTEVEERLDRFLAAAIRRAKAAEARVAELEGALRRILEASGEDLDTAIDEAECLALIPDTEGSPIARLCGRPVGHPGLCWHEGPAK